MADNNIEDLSIDIDALLSQVGKAPVAETTKTPIEEGTIFPSPTRIDPAVAAAFPYEVAEPEEDAPGFIGQMGVGFVETLGTFPKALDWLDTTLIKDDPVMREFAPRNNLLQDFIGSIDEWVEERTPEDIDLSDQIARGLGGIPLFFIPAMGAGAAANMAKLAPSIANWFRIGTMAAMDSMSTAGQVYSDELKKTGDSSRAGIAATKAFMVNLPVSVIADKYGIFEDVVGTGIKSLAHRVGASAVTGAASAGVMTPALAAIQDEEVTLADVGQSMIVGGTVAGVMGAGVHMTTNYNGKKSDYAASEATDAMMNEAHAEKDARARAVQGAEAVADTTLEELNNLTTGLARDQAGKTIGEPDFRLKTEEELLSQYVETRQGTPDTDRIISDKIFDLYDLRQKQIVAKRTPKEEQLLITDTRKRTSDILDKPIDEYRKLLPGTEEAITALVFEVHQRYESSPLAKRLRDMQADETVSQNDIDATKSTLDKSDVGVKLEVAEKKQKSVVKEVEKQAPRREPAAKKTPSGAEKKTTLEALPKVEKKQTEKQKKIVSMRDRRTQLLNERDILADEIYKSEMALEDATPAHGKLLDKMEVMDTELSRIAFALNERFTPEMKDITQLIPDFIDLVKNTATEPKVLLNKLDDIGESVYKAGMTIRDFAVGMKQVLGDLYERFAEQIVKVFESAKRHLSNERGSIRVGKDNKITADMSPEEQANVIRDHDVIHRNLNEDDMRNDMLPAIRLDDGTIHEGVSFEDIGNHAAESPRQELGYVTDEGSFIPATDIAPGATLVNETIKIPKEQKTSVNEALNLMRSDKIERIGDGKVVNNSTGAIAIGNLKNVIRKMKKKARHTKVSIEGKLRSQSFEDYLRTLGLSETAIGELLTFDAMHTRGSNVTKFITRHQEKLFKTYEEDNGIVIDDTRKTLGIPEVEEGKRMSYIDASKINRHVQEELNIKSQHMLDLEVVLDQIVDGSRYNDDRNEFMKTAHFVADLLLSPKKVLGRTEEGMALYKILDKQQIMKEKDLEHLYGKTGFDLDSILKLLRPDNKSNERIALVLDGIKKADGFLTKDETVAMQKVRDVFDYMAERFVKLKTANEHEEALVRQFAETVKVKKDEKIEGVAKKLKDFQQREHISKGGMESVDLLRMKVDNYLPHVWDRGDIIKTVAEKLQKIIRNEGENSKQAKSLADMLSRLEGGEFIMQNEIPREIFFAHMERRRGGEGYKLDTGLALHSYINGWAKKVYVEPAVNAAKDKFILLPNHQKTYAKWFIMEAAGRNKRHPGSAVVSQLEWIRTLGLSLGSALGNATGIVNTVTEAGLQPHAWEGFKRASTKEGMQEFYATGLARSIPQIVAIDEVPHVIEKVRTVAGVFFNTVERGLRNHAYHTGKAQGETMGLVGDDLVWHSIDFVNRTQHRYGVIGMAQGMRGWMGVATQFSSYPIKQAELIHGWSQTPQGRLKILSYIAMSAGLTVTMQELFNTDISNFLGVGISYGEAIETISSMTKGDWLDAEKHWKLARQGGHGILPSSVVPAGPFMSLLGQIYDTHSPRYFSRIGGELTPVMANKMVDFHFALKGGNMKTNEFPMYSYAAKDMLGKLAEGPKDMKYKLTLKSLILRTFGPRPTEETVVRAAEYSRFVTDDQILKILRKYDRAVLDGDSKGIEKLFNLYPGIVYDRGTGGALRRQERLTKTRAERDVRRLKRHRQRASLEANL